jgi:3-ketosteroid 9alpha-monooxygenase subunit B
MLAVMSEPVEGYAPLRIKRVVRETADAVSLVLDVPAHRSATFAYQAGQFLTLRVDLEGREFRRCYSMSSAPVEDELRITVKRDPGGLVSNWLNDTAAEGAELHVAPPEGRFVLRDGIDDELIAFAGGSGITPIISLVRTALATTSRRVRLFYANRGRDSVIFADALARLAAQYPGRFDVSFHYDDELGVVAPAELKQFVGTGVGDYYICGPTPFMNAVETVVGEANVPKGRVHLERFVVAPAPVDVTAVAEADLTTDEVVFLLDRKTTRASYRVGDTLLQTARTAGLKAPASCETGSCGTCMAKIVEGTVRMLNNDALDEDEVEVGWVLTCQSLPTSPTVRVDYE